MHPKFDSVALTFGFEKQLAASICFLRCEMQPGSSENRSTLLKAGAFGEILCGVGWGCPGARPCRKAFYEDWLSNEDYITERFYKLAVKSSIPKVKVEKRIACGKVGPQRITSKSPRIRA